VLLNEAKELFRDGLERCRSICAKRDEILLLVLALNGVVREVEERLVGLLGFGLASIITCRCGYSKSDLYLLCRSADRLNI
jgi:hypothetical protein